MTSPASITIPADAKILVCTTCGRPFTKATQINTLTMSCRQRKHCIARAMLPRIILCEMVQLIEDINDKAMAILHPSWWKSKWYIFTASTKENPDPCEICKPFKGTLIQAARVAQEWNDLLQAEVGHYIQKEAQAA